MAMQSETAFKPVRIEFYRGNVSVQDLIDCAAEHFPGIAFSDLGIRLGSDDLDVIMSVRQKSDNALEMYGGGIR